ncbi:uncharacterized protein LOC142225161 isoform X2 [Haematobia irritans]|uniref:uncharacterized protein LOC142225161 isoform X2 n=1 Tax=Haematobia irritans TaxID=7368 RepID=UPI003F4FEA9F
MEKSLPSCSSPDTSLVILEPMENLKNVDENCSLGKKEKRSNNSCEVILTVNCTQEATSKSGIDSGIAPNEIESIRLARQFLKRTAEDKCRVFEDEMEKELGTKLRKVPEHTCNSALLKRSVPT